MHKSLLIAAALAAATAGTTYAATCEKTSGPGTAAVLELYTSEGCSSCPPADKWLSGVSHASDAVVPLGFHVDYWDYIGWKDEFGRAAYSARQKEVASWGKSRVIYTPQVVLNGRDYREWSEGGIKRDLERLKGVPAKARLHIALVPSGNGLAAQVDASVPNAADRNGAALFLALTQSNLVTPVKAGENSGVTLHHDHVVREWIGPIAFDASGKAQLSRNLVLPKGAKLADVGVSAVVQRVGSGEVLQALALPVCKA
ncbi:MAG: hypothetical protein JWN73_4499 [Betaproteobacteria bacterium]|nr:hypothetical protein [Betaproteobacteria bacterium]